MQEDTVGDKKTSFIQPSQISPVGNKETSFT